MPMRRATSSTSVEKTRPRVLVAGVSTRALVESAARAGYAVVSVDAFGDMDNLAVPSQSLVRDLNVTYSADAAARASRDLDCQAVCYVSDLENYPSSVELLSRGRALWGNTPDVLARARDPLGLARLLRATRRPAARVRARALRTESSTEWLAKPRASGGGHGITEWHPGDQLPRSHVLQERIAGVPGSIVFVADGRNAVPFALSRQLVGDPAFGATGFQYCGSILSGTRHAVHGSASCDADHAALAALLEAAAESARALTGELALVGVNCLDFIAQAGVPHVIELNPRYSASMELAERAFDFSVFEAHVRACGGVRDGSEGSGESSGGRS
ncbi:MAG TPA: ATP-grasp domain-containing protein, partial [Gemmatimonadaceae bacterium]